MKRTLPWFALWSLVGCLALAPLARAQPRPHIGYTYPAGGQQATTLQIKLGGQGLDDVNAVLVTGSGVTARVVEYYRRLGPQEIQLLNEQLRELKRAPATAAAAMAPTMAAMAPTMATETSMMMSAMAADKSPAGSGQNATAQQLIPRIEQRVREYVQVPACASISNLVIVEVTIAPEAEIGPRELRLVTPRGVSNPLPFHVGQLPEYARKAMTSASFQVLGKESLALRKRPASEAEVRIGIPCTVNGQIASGEVNRYRFEASKGQRLVISTLGRQLIPYIADAVPGWFQPVLVLYDAKGREVAFADDYRFKPDPVILFEVPQDGEYVFTIQDSIYRGREDFVYRITVGELPFVTSLFPLGGQMDAALRPDVRGLNVRDAELSLPRQDTGDGLPSRGASRMGYNSNRVPFVLDRLPDEFDREPNNTVANAQKVTLPVVVNGRIDQSDDWDVFAFAGKANDTIVAEVQARRLDSPLDSVIKLTDATGKLLAFSDDREDLTAGVNTHHADSYVMAKLPVDGTYYVHIGDTARKGGEEYGYRLRISAPQPDFELRVVPSSVSLPLNATATVTIYAARKDGFAGPIKLALKDPPAGLSAVPVVMKGTENVARLILKSARATTKESVQLSVVGSAKLGEREFAHEAVPAEDKMQAFLWRHLVPASDLRVMVYDPRYQPPPARVPRTRPPVVVAAATVVQAVANVGTRNAGAVAATGSTAAKPKFTKQQIVGRLRQLKLLYEEGLFTDDFYDAKVAECEVPQ